MTETMAAHILDPLPFEPDQALLQKRLHIRPGSKNAAEFERLLGEARPLAHPRAVYLETYISERGEDWVSIAGVRFDSRVLHVNLEQAYRIFPYLATCGAELQEWAAGFDDMLLSFWAEAIKEAALFSALTALSAHLESHYHPGKTTTMNPGSLPDWPIQQQRVLFNLLGENSAKIGVRLTETMLMVPTKSVSGIRFPIQVDFESCQLCPRPDCPGRRAPYDASLFESRFNLHAN